MANGSAEDCLFLKELVVGGNIPSTRTGRPAYFQAQTDVQLGGWFNAAKAYMDFGSIGTGCITGFASAFNAEMVLPNKTTTGGSYTASEVNLVFQASSQQHVNPAYPTTLASFCVSGTQAKIDTWEANASGALFELKGFTEGDGKIFSEGVGGGAPTVAGTLKIIVNGVAKYLCLASKAAVN